jgi:hypothetical protein
VFLPAWPQRTVVGNDAWAGAYTFALVRNPWARQVSMFQFLLQEAMCRITGARRPKHCNARKLPEPGEWLKEPSKVAVKFREWLRQMRATFPPGHPQQHLFGARSHGNEKDAWCRTPRAAPPPPRAAAATRLPPRPPQVQRVAALVDGRRQRHPARQRRVQAGGAAS